jgi:hypothetical protein
MPHSGRDLLPTRSHRTIAGAFRIAIDPALADVSGRHSASFLDAVSAAVV